MSAGRRLAAAAAFVALVLAVLAGGLWALGGDEGEAGGGSREGVAADAFAKEELAAAATPAARSGGELVEELEAEVREASAESTDEAGQTREADETDQALELLELTEAEAEPVARRFWAAYSLYEIGLGSPAEARQIEATTSPPFAALLLEAGPPRLPAAAKRPKRAELGSFLARLAGDDNTNEELNTIDLVGSLKRGGERHPVAVEMRRGSDGRWLVWGLGR